MALLNYTTTVEAYKTVSEIEQMLVKHGAKSIMKQFDDGMITSLSFLINTGVNDIPIKLPIRVDDVLQVFICGRYWNHKIYGSPGHTKIFLDGTTVFLSMEQEKLLRIYLSERVDYGKHITKIRSQFVQ